MLVPQEAWKCFTDKMAFHQGLENRVYLARKKKMTFFKQRLKNTETLRTFLLKKKKLFQETR